VVPTHESIICKEPLTGLLVVMVSNDIHVVSGDNETFYNAEMGSLVYGNGGQAG
jgi:hypothetical protein